MPSHESPSHPFRSFLLVLLLIAAVGFGIALLRGDAPSITLQPEPTAMGGHTVLHLTLRDNMGIRTVRVFYRQKDRTLPVFEESHPGRAWFMVRADRRTRRLDVPAGRRDVAGLQDGPAELVIVATAANLRGATTEWQRSLVVRSAPPQLAALTTQHYIHQGGCDMVVYRVSDGANRSGVEMGGSFFPGYALPGAAPSPGMQTMFSIFAFPYNAPASTVPHLTASDDAGNQTTITFPATTFPHGYPRRNFVITDAFIARVIPPILANTPELTDTGDPVKNFLLVNRDLRHIDTERLIELSQKSQPRFLWKGAFHQLGNSAVEASFADHRIYQYNGQTIDEEDHLGYDLAAVAHTPVLAANAGQVLFTGYFGIYGNVVVLDHGYGLLTLYAHLNDYGVKPGDTVADNQLLGHSDSTGLAGGDHLHFSVLLDGVQVNPTEWWDPHWIHDRIEAKLAEFGGKQG